MGEQNVAIHRFTRMANFFLVAENDELTLIDTGNKDSLDNIRGKLNEKGYDLDQLKRIVISGIAIIRGSKV